MIPVYNCAEFVRETLSSVLVQDLGVGQMQIEVVDDASTDADVAALVEELGKGRVSYFRQPTNVGSLRNFETCLNRSRGQLIHLLHGDDRVRAGFYHKLADLLARYPQAGAAFCNYYTIDSTGTRQRSQLPEMDHDGIVENWFYKIAAYQRTQYVSMVVRRSVYEEVGSFYGVTYGEDWEMWVRIARRYPVAYSPEPLAEYRAHTNSISSQKVTAYEALQDLRATIDRIGQHLPTEIRQQVSTKSIRYYVALDVKTAFNQWRDDGEGKNLTVRVKKALGVYSGSDLYPLIAMLVIKKSIQRFWRLWTPRKR